MGYPPLATEDSAHLIVTEFSRSVQGFLVSDVDRIVHVDGGNMAAPPAALGYGPRVNAVTRLDGNLLAVVDVEQVLASVDPRAVGTVRPRAARHAGPAARRMAGCWWWTTPSSRARNWSTSSARWTSNASWPRTAAKGSTSCAPSAMGPAADRIDLVVSDIEMPAMDGYALTRAIREDAQLRHLKVLLHSSLSGVFNEAMVERVGADRFIAKFQPDVLATAVLGVAAGLIRRRMPSAM